jgi:hypothetical protein
VHLEIRFHGGRGSAQGLGNDLATIQSAPRIPWSNSNEGVGSVGLEIEQSAGVHALERNY